VWEKSLGCLVGIFIVFEFIGGSGGGDWDGRAGDTEVTGGDFDGVWYTRLSLGDDFAGLKDDRDLFGDFVYCIYNNTQIFTQISLLAF
jgi:hypothetical protein